MVLVFLGFAGGAGGYPWLGDSSRCSGYLCMDMEYHSVSGLPPDHVGLCSLAVERNLLGRSFFYRIEEKIYHDLH